ICHPRPLPACLRAHVHAVSIVARDPTLMRECLCPMKRLVISGLFASLSVITTITGTGQGTNGSALTAGVLKGLEFRSIGPALATGRIQDVQIDPKNPSVWYVASAFGGLWKTTNRGIAFTPIFEEGGSFTLCCVAIDPKDSNIIWLATGEN